MSNVMAGFSTTGIFPLNREALLPHHTSVHSLCERTSLLSIPLFSPQRPIRESTRIPVTPSSPHHLSLSPVPTLQEMHSSTVQQSYTLPPDLDSSSFTSAEEALF